METLYLRGSCRRSQGFSPVTILFFLVSTPQLVAMYASSWVLVMAAVDRYVSICHPLTSQTLTPKRVHLMISLAWSLSLVFSLPQFFIFSYTDPTGGRLIDWLVGRLHSIPPPPPPHTPKPCMPAERRIVVTVHFQTVHCFELLLDTPWKKIIIILDRFFLKVCLIKAQNTGLFYLYKCSVKEFFLSNTDLIRGLFIT